MILNITQSGQIDIRSEPNSSLTSLPKIIFCSSFWAGLLLLYKAMLQAALLYRPFCRHLRWYGHFADLSGGLAPQSSCKPKDNRKCSMRAYLECRLVFSFNALVPCAQLKAMVATWPTQSSFL